MQLHYFRPKSKLLARYLEGYYLLEKERDEPAVEYFTFPNNFSILSVLADSQLLLDGRSATVKEKNGSDLISTLICHYQKPIRIRYEGKIRELTFYFKPLGLNAFLENPLQRYLGNSFQPFLPFEDYEPTMRALLCESDREKQRVEIERYWLSKLVGFENPLLRDVLADLAENTEEISIEQLATKYHTSRQNIARQFQLHIGKKPSEFKKIQRFRETMAKNIKGPHKQSTALRYDSSFYDQSHLIKDFKSFTGLTPKAFFKSVSLQENATINWLFL